MLTKLVDYEYYSESYGGSSIPKLSFQKKVIESSNRINYYTTNRISENILGDNIKNAVCEIAEFIYSQEVLKEKMVDESQIKVSETVGPHSINYSNNKNFQENMILTNEEFEQECYKICLRYLCDTGLMNRGID